MVFIDGMTSKALAREAVAGIRGPVAINVVEGGKSPEAFTFAEMEAMGIARVSLPGTLMLAAIQGMRDALAAVRANGYAGGPERGWRISARSSTGRLRRGVRAGAALPVRAGGAAAVRVRRRARWLTGTRRGGIPCRQAPRNIIEKIWEQHVVAELEHEQALLHVDRILLHDRAGPRVLAALREAAAPWPARPGVRHHGPYHRHPARATTTRWCPAAGLHRRAARRAGAPASAVRPGDPQQGIAHVISPELGIALPGTTLVCCDSHTCTVGGIGALALHRHDRGRACGGHPVPGARRRAHAA